MPEVPQLKTCCFCCSTEVGSKIIGWLSLIGSALGAIAGVLALTAIIPKVGKDQSQGGTTPEDIALVAFALIVYVLMIVLAVYLLVGIHKKNMAYVRLWLYVATVTLFVRAVVTVITIITAIFGMGSHSLIELILNLCILAYFVLVVYSYYRENKQAGIPATY